MRAVFHRRENRDFLWFVLVPWEIRIHHENSPGIFLRLSYFTFIKAKLMIRKWKFLKPFFSHHTIYEEIYQ